MELLTPQIIALTLSLGAFAGFLAGLLGIGGGVILVPLFLWLFPLAKFPPELVVHSAFGTSLAIILPTAVSSTLGHRKRGNVDWHMVVFLALGGVVGSLLGSSAAALISGDRLKMCFGLMQIIVSLKLLFYKQSYLPPGSHDRADNLPLMLVGFVGGFFSAFFGIGGGVIAVPLMLIFLHLPIHLAVGNSSALIVVSSFFAVSGYVWYGLQQAVSAPFSWGYVNFLIALIVAPLTMAFARLGVKLASRTSQTKLVKVFAVLLLFVGVRILLKL
ncbi:MAG: sulfite exporter TauE/SafE family protein [Desulfuromonadales bacterium]|nr:sulfite exporter TauE/SafE family protein [Desulfuromonadales bacterium]MBN2793744.1 sulfite exporter TauE/SafE family protein [Desulfuromonadales bacterium]